MKPKRAAVVTNRTKDQCIETLWNLPVRLDALTDYAVSGGDIVAVAEAILDTAVALAYRKGTWYGQDSVEPIRAEVIDSFALVSSTLHDDPYQLARLDNSLMPGDPRRVQRAAECLGELLSLFDEAA